ncbi:unnamed protein product [Miscanthus lutarioriparius]|uniref:Uncharacterized protein n=1 Tax=Miscanthus lutarioriparius TaxID=422564 RepID=A0A811NRR1_9POAL|nr:unnamed protein product [Miscanthus lutarioriparius]
MSREALSSKQALQERTAGEQGMQRTLRDANIQKGQLLEKRQVERFGIGSIREVKGAEASDAKGGREAVH